jgi:hypothetical protein
MKKLSFIIGLAVMLLFSGKQLVAQSVSEDINNKFFSILKDKGPEVAYDYLYSDNKAIQKNDEQIKAGKTAFVDLVKQYGEYCGYDFISKEETGKSIIKYTYMLKYDNSPLKFVISFYKPKENWKVYEVNFMKMVDEKMPQRQLPFRSLR